MASEVTKDFWLKLKSTFTKKNEIVIIEKAEQNQLDEKLFESFSNLVKNSAQKDKDFLDILKSMQKELAATKKNITKITYNQNNIEHSGSGDIVLGNKNTK